jgi:hypothetical protein
MSGLYVLRNFDKISRTFDSAGFTYYATLQIFGHLLHEEVAPDNFTHFNGSVLKICSKYNNFYTKKDNPHQYKKGYNINHIERSMWHPCYDLHN